MYWGIGISGSGPGRMQNSMCTGQPHSLEMVSSAVNSVRLRVPPPGYKAFLLKGPELQRTQARFPKPRNLERLSRNGSLDRKFLTPPPHRIIQRQSREEALITQELRVEKLEALQWTAGQQPACCPSEAGARKAGQRLWLSQ